jgi:hypothetical protein
MVRPSKSQFHFQTWGERFSGKLVQQRFQSRSAGDFRLIV